MEQVRDLDSEDLGLSSSSTNHQLCDPGQGIQTLWVSISKFLKHTHVYIFT